MLQMPPCAEAPEEAHILTPELTVPIERGIE